MLLDFVFFAFVSMDLIHKQADNVLRYHGLLKTMQITATFGYI